MTIQEAEQIIDDPSWPSTQTEQEEARRVLARAWLAEHPADDDEPVTTEWVGSLGPLRVPSVPVLLDIQHDGTVNVLACGDDSDLIDEVIVHGLATVKTKGEARSLCTCLGITLTNQGAEG